MTRIEIDAETGVYRRRTKGSKMTDLFRNIGSVIYGFDEDFREQGGQAAALKYRAMVREILDELDRTDGKEGMMLQ